MLLLKILSCNWYWLSTSDDNYSNTYSILNVAVPSITNPIYLSFDLMLETNMADDASSNGTFIAPYYTVAENSDSYAAINSLFDTLEWPSNAPKPKRADGLQQRFNALCSVLKAVCDDPDGIVHMAMNKKQYDLFQYAISYRAVKDIRNVLLENGLLKPIGKSRMNVQQRYKASNKLKLREPIAFVSLGYSQPLIEFRRGNKGELEKAPVDIEFMYKPEMQNLISKYIKPKMDALNDKLLSHEFEIPSNPWGTQPQYRRIFSNSSTLEGGRIYPRDFIMPDKKLRKKITIDGNPVSEVDIHACALNLLYNFRNVPIEFEGDLYQANSLKDLDRLLVKSIINASMNGLNLNSKDWPASLTEKQDVAERIGSLKPDWKHYVNCIKATYPLLASKKQVGMYLWLLESDNIMFAMNYLLDRGIGCLSIHDCLIVPHDKTADAKDAINAAYAKQGFPVPRLSVE